MTGRDAASGIDPDPPEPGGSDARAGAAVGVPGPDACVLPPGRSIREFLTDGALAAMCARLGELVGLSIEVRDERGALVVAEPDRSPVAADGAPWQILEDVRPIAPDATRIPIHAGGTDIGEIVVEPGEPRAGGGSRGELLGAVEHLARASGELCEDVIELRDRVRELGVLYRLSSLLAGGETDLRPMLGVVLDSALEVLGLDAGAIVLFPEDADGVPAANNESELAHEASRGLSGAWLESPLPLSRERCFDRLVLDGEVLAVPDLARDDRVLEPSRCEAEGLVSFLSAAMVAHGRPLGVIRLYGSTPRAFTEADRRLIRSIGDQAATGVQQARLLEVQERDRQRDRQLRLAAQVQGRMLPEKLPRIDGLSLAARSIPSHELGGDFYDAELGKGVLNMLVGDVVGKGVPAAMLMSSLLASLRASAPHVHEVDAWIGDVNDAMCRTTQPNEFATMWCGRLDPRTLRLTYTSAGHEPPLIVRPPEGGGPVMRDHLSPLVVGGLVLGVAPGQTYPRYVYQLRPGDLLIAHSDGLTDARNFDGQRFGFERLAGAVVDAFSAYGQTHGPTAEQAVDHVLWSVRRFTGLCQRTDDETILALRVEPEGRSS